VNDEDFPDPGAPGSRDLRFEAIFYDRIAVPEPGSLLLLASGLLGIAGVGWRRRRSMER
jgi:hypothetical protein